VRLRLRNHVVATSRSIAFEPRNVRVRSPERKADASRGRQVLHPTPWMQDASPILDQREVVAAARGLIMGPIDREAGIVTEQKGTDSAVADEQYVTRSISGQHAFDLADDAQLGIDRPLPSPDADKGICEKLTGHRLELVGG
jgi:hypothetical protein